MPFPNIQDLRFYQLKSRKYFLDTNVWLAVVSQILESADKKYTQYLKFFEQILSSQLKPKPSVLLCNLQVSEIINAYLRQIAMRRYIQEEKVGVVAHDYFKMVYRSTTHYEIQHKLIRDEIQGYQSILEMTDDFYTALQPMTLLKDLSTKMDYNDHYYHKLCVHIQKSGQGVSIVTHDSDFKFNDVEILTDNQKLKDLRYN